MRSKTRGFEVKSFYDGLAGQSGFSLESGVLTPSKFAFLWYGLSRKIHRKILSIDNLIKRTKFMLIVLALQALWGIRSHLLFQWKVEASSCVCLYFKYS